MALLNLSLVEFLAVLLPAATAVVALYLYDRARRRQIVSTLRFFRRPSSSLVFIRRKKIQQPWSLLLQLICFALLLLAIAELHLGRRSEAARDHVLILETSAWMNSVADGRTALMETARRRALDYLRAVPGQDRVMLVRADALPTPVTTFTRNRAELQAAIRSSRAGSSALDLTAALEFARSAQRLSSSKPGEIAVVGSGRAQRTDLEQVAALELSNLRAILVGHESNDCGIRKLAARRLPADLLEWEIDLGAFNYGPAARRVPVTVTFAGTRVGSRTLQLGPGAAAEASFRLRSAKAGALEAVLDSRDEYRTDNRAAIELPALAPLKIQVFTSKPALWRPLLTASVFLGPEFHQPGEYRPQGAPGRLVILDGFTPAVTPDADAVWISPAARTRRKIHVRRWNVTHPLTAGLHNRDLEVESSAVLAAGRGDEVVAETEAGPVLLASQAGEHKKVVFGFHPLEGSMANHLAIPLLFANLAHWVSPDLFRLAEISAGTPGLVELATPAGTRREQVMVGSAKMPALPFTLVEDRLRFFVGQAGTVRVTLPEQEVVYSLTLPELGDSQWSPPSGARRGIPPPAPAMPLNRDLWPWLALAGALGLAAEWMWFGRNPVVAAAAGRREPEAAAINQEQPASVAEEVRS
ncbi:MAG: VWA domain-containing protein [Acidobacteria bacterium]|nr:VWA domain-containing protein [Acidobacteriota bacterium]